MVDDMQGGMAAGTPDAPLGSPGAQTPPPEPPAEGKKGFLSTTLGKVVVILGAVLLLLVIAGAAAIIVFTFLLGDAADEMADEVARDHDGDRHTWRRCRGRPSRAGHELRRVRLPRHLRVAVAAAADVRLLRRHGGHGGHH